MRTAVVSLVSVVVAALVGALALAQPEYAWLHGLDARGRPVALAELRGQVVALTFVSRATRDEGSDINDELAKLAQPGRMTVLSVVDLEGVPSFGHGTALSKIAESDRPGLVHVVDDAGRLKQAFGVDPTHQVDILVIDRDGEVRGRFVGEAGLAQAERLIEELLR